jgi:cell division protein FtsI (penicillin-binding protein 3)
MTEKEARSRADRFGPPPNGTQRVRIRLLQWAWLVAFGYIGVHLTQIHISPDPRLLESDAKRVGRFDIKIPRGEIYDRRGKVLATDRQVPALVANPMALMHKDYVGDPMRLAAQVAEVLKMETAAVHEQLMRRRDGGTPAEFAYVKRWLTIDEAQALEQSGLVDGKLLRLQKEPARFYPHGDVASHVLGFASRERVGAANVRAGAEGVELAFDRYLRNINGVKHSRVDVNRTALESRTVKVEEPRGGDHVYLTIDLSLQHKLELELERARVENNAERATGVLMDPKTGAILALACLPSFDPNRYWEFTAAERTNRAITDVFEPGSAFKLVTAAAALEDGAVQPDEIFDGENGVIYRGRRRIRDFHPMKEVTFAHAFQESSNIIMLKAAERLGDDRFADWISRFGFGQRTCTDWRGESPGIFRSDTGEWSGYSRDSLSFGQEIAVNAIQLARAFSVVANGGYLVEPHVVDRAVGRDGLDTYVREAPEAARLLSDRTVNIMREFCHAVVTDGTATAANIPEYRVGGKTGTAQIANAKSRGYRGDRNTPVFAGFAPIVDPKLVAVIVVHAPDVKMAYGGRVCGPVFKEVVRHALIEMGVPKDPVAGMVAEVEAEAGDPDTVIPPFDLAELDASLDDLLEPMDEELAAAAGDTSQALEAALPDFSGLTKSQARAILVNLDLDWLPQGAGWVVDQDPPAGTPLTDVTRCRLTFESKTADALDSAPSRAAADRL